MNPEVETGPADGRSRFAAFISYRHEAPDRQLARAIQPALENYLVPPRLRDKVRVDHYQVHGRGRKARKRPLQRLVYLDVRETSAGVELDPELRKHIEDAYYLVVLCSAAYLTSDKARFERQYFLSLGRPRQRILNVVVNDKVASALPPEAYIDREDGTRAELVAAHLGEGSLREKLSAVRGESLKLLSPILGIPLAELEARDREFERQRWRTRLVIATLLMIVLGSTTLYAVQQRRRANRNLEQALMTIDAVNTTVSKELRDVPGTAHVVAQVVDLASQLHRIVQEDWKGDDRLRRAEWSSASAEAFGLLEIGQREKGIIGILRAVELARENLRQEPDSLQARWDLYSTELTAAEMMRGARAPSECLTHVQAGAKMLEEISARETDTIRVRYEQGRCAARLAAILTSTDPQGALDRARYGRDTLQELHQLQPWNQKYTYDLAASHLQLGELYRAANLKASARSEFEASRDLLLQVPEPDRDSVKFFEDQVRWLKAAAIEQFNEGDSPGAIQDIKDAIVLQRRLFAKEPWNGDRATSLADALNTLTILLATSGRPAEAFDPIDDAIALARSAVDRSKADSPAAWGLYRLLADRTRLLFQSGRLPEALAALEETSAVEARYAKSFPPAWDTSLIPTGLEFVRIASTWSRTSADERDKAMSAVRQRLKEFKKRHPDVVDTEFVRQYTAAAWPWITDAAIRNRPETLMTRARDFFDTIRGLDVHIRDEELTSQLAAMHGLVLSAKRAGAAVEADELRSHASEFLEAWQAMVKAGWLARHSELKEFELLIPYAREVTNAGR